MAKDGTNRGGARIGAGRKAKPLTEKIVEGKAKKSNGKSNNSKKSNGTPPEIEPATLIGLDMPPLKEYLTAEQKDGSRLITQEIYAETWQWLISCGCEQAISAQLIEQYAMSVARWVQCEECVSKYGLLAKHPTTGNAIQSPYVSMAQAYMKQVNQAWYQIIQIVRENSSTQGVGRSPQDNLMEKLLNARSGK